MDERILALRASRSPEPPAEPARRRRVAVRRGRRRTTRRRRDRGGGRDRRRGRRAARRCAPTRPGSARCGGCARRAPASRPGWPTAPRRGRAGRTRPSRRTRLGAYLRDFRALLERHGLRGLTYGHFGEGCIHVRIDFDLASRRRRRARSAGSSRRARTWWRGTAARCPASTATGRCALGAAAAHVLAGGDRAVRAVQGRLGPARPDEPRHGRAARTGSTRTCAFAAAARPSDTTTFTYPHDDGDFAQALRRCVGVAQVPRPRRRR